MQSASFSQQATALSRPSNLAVSEKVRLEGLWERFLTPKHLQEQLEDLIGGKGGDATLPEG